MKTRMDAKNFHGRLDTTQPDVTPFFDYLRSGQGHELASRIVALVEGIKKATLDKNADISIKQIELARIHRRNTQILQGLIIAGVILATSFLVYHGKFDSTVGVLFGTLIGYIFGRRNGADRE
jgi:hypothetical protein